MRHEELQKTLERAKRCLARRDYGEKELFTYLLQKGHARTDVEQVVKMLQSSGLLADLRYAQAYCRGRIQRGYGPLRIQQELQQKGVDSDIIAEAMRKQNVDWTALVEKVRVKKFGPSKPDSFEAKQKQIRFLNYRGFDHSLVADVI
ncbi:MAG: recombination regulator RecX [Gammaproteobacteria bacterium]|nr:recombination regulator RecX [Gammaproteobacteria bacterium]MDH5728948.1 recombination regulator RecX [Gammaproteobacteria bacterium]